MIPQFSLANLDALRSMLYGGMRGGMPAQGMPSQGMPAQGMPPQGIQAAWGAQPPMARAPLAQPIGSPMMQQSPMMTQPNQFPNLMALRAMAPQAQNNLRMPMMRQF